jgi:uncharacterized protein with von Willebrand factor type A (vWA) domain
MATNDGRFARLEERLLGWVTGGGGSGGDDFAPWQPLTVAAQAQWDRETALIERIERGEASETELDDVEALIRRLADERAVEERAIARTRRALSGGGTAHGRLPMALSCACGCCKDFRRG